jgi:hypothetical protein
LTRFLIACLALTLIFTGLWFVLINSGLVQYSGSLFWQIQIFVVFSTGLLFIYLYKARREHFVQLYLLTMVVKLLAYGGFAIFIILEDQTNARVNIGLFLSYYVVYTLLELVFLFPKINR